MKGCVVAVWCLIAGMALGCADKASPGSHRVNRGRVKSGQSSIQDVTRTYVIFADVTCSLSEREHGSVEDRVGRVIELIPPAATVVVFPILEDVERAPAVYSVTLPGSQTTGESVDFSVTKARVKAEVVKRLHDIARGSTTGRKLTCISGALRKAEEVTVDADATHPVEVIIVSDMLEDCSHSLFGGKLSLEKESILREIGAARALPMQPLLKLNGASVTMLLTTEPTAPGTTKRPEAHDLEIFWREILDRSGDEKANFRFGTEIPRRLQILNADAAGGL